MANEKRLIDANALIATFEKSADEDEVPFFHLDEITQEIFDAPTVDAVEVVHGRWRFRKNWDFFVCSECSHESSNYSKYCPNCGAKMDGDGNG